MGMCTVLSPVQSRFCLHGIQTLKLKGHNQLASPTLQQKFQPTREFSRALQ